MARPKNWIKIGDEVTTLKIGVLEKKSKITNIRIILENGDIVELEEMYLTKPERKEKVKEPEHIEHRDEPTPSKVLKEEIHEPVSDVVLFTKKGILCPTCKDILTPSSEDFINRLIKEGKNKNLTCKCKTCKETFYFDKVKDKVVYRKVMVTE